MTNARPQQMRELQLRINEQAERVRSLKGQRASRAEVQEAVTEYLRLCDLQRASSSPSSARLIAQTMEISEAKMASAIQEYKNPVAGPVALNRDSSTESVVDIDDEKKPHPPSQSSSRRP